jgi:hypothetical protein
MESQIASAFQIFSQFFLALSRSTPKTGPNLLRRGYKNFPISPFTPIIPLFINSILANKKEGVNPLKKFKELF